MSDDCSAVAIVSHAGHFGPSAQSQASNVSQFPSTPHAVTPVATGGTNRVTEPEAAQCEWIPAHTTDYPNNDRVDRLAREAALSAG